MIHGFPKYLDAVCSKGPCPGVQGSCTPVSPWPERRSQAGTQKHKETPVGGRPAAKRRCRGEPGLGKRLDAEEMHVRCCEWGARIASSAHKGAYTSRPPHLGPSGWACVQPTAGSGRLGPSSQSPFIFCFCDKQPDPS